ncbi:amino acid permease [Clostridium autoethanogenum]|uniref:Arginine/ornithine antiporter n=2 Tax=Clostridium TaxID=1485 RepID=D8GNJ0_CLOLD|nr:MULTISPECIES: basic amino acid/polyamine antiporter [Clostridium]ADK15853.1 predicted arginine/ornithine antiporter [Clostridium ljungdahlii DSM 13528]OAA84277.1 Arginine/ornithine antiporter [Clostridium ljungdahlii DSM 13528]RMC99634.1 amino acid permease [Clostridium autoethanogenum]
MQSGIEGSVQNQGEGKLGLVPLIGLVIGSIIGGGAFSFPADMAKVASPGAIIIAWIITGVGMFTLGYVFQNLSQRKPDLDCGIYSYAKAGFGEYTGFNCAWGHWVSSMLGDVSYLVMLFCTIGYFFPVFGNGNNLPALIGESILIWGVNVLILKGVKTAAWVNVLTTIGKLIPIFIFIIVSIIMFKVNIFTLDFWGNMSTNLGSVLTQVKGTMLITLWAFIGIESAVVFSKQAKVRKDISKATIIGLLGVLVIYVLVSLLALGTMKQAQLAGLKSPSMAYALEYMVGKSGAIVVNIGLIISLLGAFLGWTLICSELSYSAGKGKAFPKFFTEENANGAPKNALLVTNIVTQVFLIWAFFAKSSYQILYAIASSAVLVPYFFSALYALKLTITKETYTAGDNTRIRDMAISGLSVIYAVWLIYAAGLSYMLLLTILFSGGILVFYKARKEGNTIAFTNVEKGVVTILVILAVISVYMIVSGKITI